MFLCQILIVSFSSTGPSFIDAFHYICRAGIIANAEESRFAYNRPGESWLFFFQGHDRFRPVFDAVFDNPQLEEEAIERCGDDSFCLFDVATTKRIEVGVSTMQESQSVDEEIELATPSESSDSIVK